MSRPEDIMYSKTHEWARIEDDVATVGITDYAVEQLGDLAFIELPQDGTQVQQGERFGEIESTKTVSDLVAPLSGEVIEVNKDVDDELEVISRSPFENGWLIKIRCSDPSESSDLLTRVEYDAHVQSEEE